MKAILEFTLPEEREEYIAASRAMDVRTELEQLDNELRAVIKHGATTETIGDTPGIMPKSGCDDVIQWVRARLYEIRNGET